MNRLALALLCLSGNWAQAQAQTGAPPSVSPSAVTSTQNPVVLVVAPLRDAGGIATPETGKNRLNERFTLGIRNFLADKGKGHFAVLEEWPEKRASNTSYLGLEGELSHLEDLGAYGGSYLCTLRLFAADAAPGSASPSRRLIGQWCGYARTLRYLTSNLVSDSRVNTEGLLGELGTRVCAQVQDFESRSPGLQMARLVAATYKPLPSGESAPTAAPMQITVKAAKKVGTASPNGFHLQIKAPHAGSVFLVVPGAPNQPVLRLVSLSKSETQVPAQRPTVLPASRPLSFQAQDANAEVLVLLRNQNPPNVNGTDINPIKKAPVKPKKPDGKPSAVSDSKKPLKADKTPSGMLSPIALPSSATPIAPQMVLPPVQVIGEGLPPGTSAPLDVGLVRLMRQIERDPAGTWTAQRVVMGSMAPVVPAAVPPPVVVAP
ncbi:MAG TPA: hypothetical protein VGB45_06210 [Abditibacterium sp.]|jgi:hypothetical protein